MLLVIWLFGESNSVPELVDVLLTDREKGPEYNERQATLKILSA